MIADPLLWLGNDAVLCKDHQVQIQNQIYPKKRDMNVDSVDLVEKKKGGPVVFLVCKKWWLLRSLEACLDQESFMSTSTEARDFFCGKSSKMNSIQAKD